MVIQVDRSGLAAARWRDFLLRFLFGGVVTAAAGLVLQRFGPAVGGLFLGFPAIFPATATFIEKSERKRKSARGMHGERRGRRAAGAEAAGAAIGSFGLMLFAAVVWGLAPAHSGVLTLVCGLAVWFIGACAAWYVVRR
jgi:hypothetical protein